MAARTLTHKTDHTQKADGLLGLLSCFEWISGLAGYRIWTVERIQGERIWLAEPEQK